MKIIFITSGKINYIFSGCSLYESILLTAEGKRFPHIVSSAEEINKIVGKMKILEDAVILSAPSSQAKETADILGRFLGKEAIRDRRLLPLRFDLKRIISEEEFNSLGGNAFNVLRSRFLDAFFEDRLADKQEDFKKKYHEFMLDVTSRYYDKTVIAASHSYIIQLFFIYSKVGEKMFKDRNLLRKLFNPSRPLGFLKTIEMNISYN